ncbi:unnamed protein product, partial [Rotaria sordida]
MSQNYHRKQGQSGRRKSTTFPVIIVEQEELDNGRRLSVCPNYQRRLSNVSQLYLPNGSEYHPQERIPPSGLEHQTTFLLTRDENDNNENNENNENERRLSIIDRYHSTDHQLTIDQYKENKYKKRILFIIEPILTAFLLFPILVLFWETGWNLILIFLNVLNKFSPNLHLSEITQEDFESYTWESLVYPYLVVQILLLCFYIFQDLIYNYCKKQKWIIKTILLKFHIFIIGTIYIVQWEMIWTIWDQFTPHEWYFEFTLSLLSLFALIVFIGHLSDLICSPFLVSYDSIEYCIQFGCPLLT